MLGAYHRSSARGGVALRIHETGTKPARNKLPAAFYSSSLHPRPCLVPPRRSVTPTVGSVVKTTLLAARETSSSKDWEQNLQWWTVKHTRAMFGRSVGNLSPKRRDSKTEKASKALEVLSPRAWFISVALLLYALISISVDHQHRVANLRGHLHVKHAATATTQKRLRGALDRASSLQEPLDETTECQVCMARAKDTALVPCGHVLCAQCVTRSNDERLVEECPVCRETVRSTMRVYI